MEGPCESGRMDLDSRQPRILKCGKPGRERRDVPSFFTSPILCDACHQAIKARDRA